MWFPWPKTVFTLPCLQRARASGWSRTVTNRLVRRLSQQDLSPRFAPPSTTLPHCNRFRLILYRFVILCIMQPLKLPGLHSKEREWGWWNRVHFQSSFQIFSLSCLGKYSLQRHIFCCFGSLLNLILNDTVQRLDKVLMFILDLMVFT